MLRIDATSIGRTGGTSSWRVRVGSKPGGKGDWGGFGKKERTKPLARSSAVVASRMRGREAGGGGSRKRLAAHSSFAEAVSRKFFQWADLALFIARKYARLAVETALREEQSASSEECSALREERLDWWRRTAAWKTVRRVERSSDHQGLDQLEDLRRGTERQRTALRLLRVSVTHLSGSAGEGSIGMAWR